MLDLTARPVLSVQQALLAQPAGVEAQAHQAVPVTPAPSANVAATGHGDRVERTDLLER